MKSILSLLCLLLTAPLFSQIHLSTNPDILTRNWEARWISHPDIQRQAEAVIHFRKSFDLAATPDSFIVHVSADNRYILYVNGEKIGRGPARGDQRHWRFETYDLAEYLNQGQNVIAAVVWNFGDLRPQAQMSHETAFIVQGDTKSSSIANTDQSWKCWQNEKYGLIDPADFQLYCYFVVGPGEVMDGNHLPQGWTQTDFQDDAWKEPRRLEPGHPRGTGTGANWMLVPRQIPQMMEKPIATGVLRQLNGSTLYTRLDSSDQGMVLPNTTATLLIDQEELVTAYPIVCMSRGAGSRIRLTYAEATFGEGEPWELADRKAHRDSIEGTTVVGNYDEIISNGESDQAYSPLWWRTWRYLKLDITTGEDTLFLDHIGGLETRYPFEAHATFEAPGHRLDEIWKVGWRTAQLCGHETYVDCPYYEQLQYVGDTRIQALISLYVSGDSRLMKRSINDFADSFTPDGLTQSRYPCATEQIIPPYSLFWVSMLHDYWMHVDDPEFVREHLRGVEQVLYWYLSYVNEQDLLGAHPWWNFVDWSWSWPAGQRYGGVPPGNETHSSILTLQLIYTLQQAADLMERFGRVEKGEEYRNMVIHLRDAAYRAYFEQEKGLFADTPEKNSYSQHANILAILTDAIPAYQQPAMLEQILTDTTLTQATFYFRFYLTRAMVKTNTHDRYLQELNPWREMLDLGLTTFAEKPEPTRSDCHAWSASPNYEFLATVCGIRPAREGFSSVLIAPELGDLRSVKASMPHPLGEISVNFVKRGEVGILAEITLPEGLEGEFVFRDQAKYLRSGSSRIEW